MLLTLTVIANFIRVRYQRAQERELGQSEVTYLLIVIGAVAIAAIVIAAITTAVNGKLPDLKL
jgi:hypothetical protein